MDAETQRAFAGSINALVHAVAELYARFYHGSGMTQAEVRSDMDAIMARFEAMNSGTGPRTPENFALNQQGLATLEHMFSTIVIETR